MSNKILIALFLLFSLVSCDTQSSEELWLPLKEVDLRIAPGTALDFSKQFDGGWFNGRRVGIENGHLDNGDKFRAMCATYSFLPSQGGFPSHEASDDYAQQLRLQGYNWVRLVFLDAAFMARKRQDLDFDTEQLDRFHYFLYALKKAGIYWQIGLTDSVNAAWGDVSGGRFGKNKHLFHLEVYYDQKSKEHWKKLASKLLLTKNKYTGLTLVEDPALAMITLMNENGLDSLMKKYVSESRDREVKHGVDKFAPGLDKLFRQWLLERYGSLEGIAKAWGSPDSPSIPLHVEETPRMEDFLRFIVSLQASTYQWMSGYVNELGYQGLFSQFNNGARVVSGAGRGKLEHISMHAYHDNLGSGGAERQRLYKDVSSLDDKQDFLGKFLLSRQYGKSFFAEEYNQVFPNQWRREAGMLIPAYAAFQGWDGVCRYQRSVELEYRKDHNTVLDRIGAFTVGLDPIAHAGEKLAALLFRRGDVSQAKNNINLTLSDDEVFSAGRGWNSWPRALLDIGLIAGVSVSYGDSKDVPDGVSATRPYLELFSANKALKEKALEAKNQRLFRSDTEELYLNRRGHSMQVVTPRTEAVTFERARGISLDALTVVQSSDGALVSVSSLDKQPIKSSERLLLMILTDAHNSGMKINSKWNARQVMQQGTLPPLIKSATFDLTLAHEQPDNLTLYALDLSGNRREVIPLKRADNKLAIHLDIAQQKKGPTLFYELARQ